MRLTGPSPSTSRNFMSWSLLRASRRKPVPAAEGCPAAPTCSVHPASNARVAGDEPRGVVLQRSLEAECGRRVGELKPRTRTVVVEAPVGLLQPADVEIQRSDV